MSWRDDPNIIWQDDDGDRLYAGRNTVTGVLATCVINQGGIESVFYTPETAGGWDELLHRLAAVAGRRITGIETAPEPIKMGDLVLVGPVGPFRVLHVDGSEAMVRHAERGYATVIRVDRVTRANSPEPACRYECCHHDRPICAGKDPDTGYMCTLASGHGGSHVACNDEEHGLAVWRNPITEDET